jgi:hypothetical protein
MGNSNKVEHFEFKNELKNEEKKLCNNFLVAFVDNDNDNDNEFIVMNPNNIESIVYNANDKAEINFVSGKTIIVCGQTITKAENFQHKNLH